MERSVASEVLVGLHVWLLTSSKPKSFGNNKGCIANCWSCSSLLSFENVGSIPTAPMTKVCSKCKEEKSVDEFHRRRDKWQPYCKSCKKENDAEYRLANMDYFIRKKKLQKIAFRRWYFKLKSGPCSDCGNTFHPVAMQWDHLPEFEKSSGIATLYQHCNRTAILEEIQKCDLLCSNCHAIRTWERTKEKFDLDDT